MHGVGKEVIEIWAIFDTMLRKYDGIALMFQYYWDALALKKDGVVLPEFTEAQAKMGDISITLLPTPCIFWHIQAHQTLIRPNISKYVWGW